MVGNWTVNLDRRGSVVQEGEQELEVGGHWTANLDRRESVGYVGEYEQEDGGKLDSKLRWKSKCWVGGRIEVGGWLENWTANLDRRESVGG